MKTKIIGRCQDCKWLDRFTYSDGKVQKSGDCEYMNRHLRVIGFEFMVDVKKFGCWYWEKRTGVQNKI